MRLTLRRRQSWRRAWRAAAAGMLLALVPATSSAAATADVTRDASTSLLADGSSYTQCPGGGAIIEEVWLGKGYADHYQVYYGYTDLGCGQPGVVTISGYGVPSEFSFGDQLSSAHVAATIQLTNEQTGEPAGRISIDETWVANGPPKAYSDNQNYGVPGEFREIFHFARLFRPATGTGTVAVADAMISRLQNTVTSVTP